MSSCSECTFFYSEKSLCVRTPLAEQVSKDGSCSRHTPKSSPNSCKYCTSGGYKFDYLGGVVIGATNCQHCNVDGHKKPTDVMIGAFPSLFKSNAVSCGACNHYNPHISKCLNNDVMKQMRQANDWCSKYEPKQEEKQMKNYITETHEVKLDGEWHVIEPVINSDTKVMFTDPRPMIAGIAPAAPAPIPGAFIVSYLMIYKGDPYYHAKRTMRVILNDQLNVIATMETDAPARPLIEGEQYAIIMLD